MIFVNIASYGDRGFEACVHDLYAKARYPTQIRVTIVSQSNPADTSFHHERVRIVSMGVTPRTSSWMHAKGYEYLDGEDFILQVSSFTRFARHWDQKFIRQLAVCTADKPILTTYPHPYGRDDAQASGRDVATIIAVEYVDHQGYIHLTGYGLDPAPMALRRAAVINPDCFFTHARFLHEIAYDPTVPGVAEATMLSLTVWCHGWDLYNPNEALLWQNTPHPAHGDETAAGLVCLTATKALGAVRDLQSFEDYSGINLRARAVTQVALDGLWDSDNDAVDWMSERFALSMHWGDGESQSGPGSSVLSTRTLREQLPSAFRELNIRTLVNAGCGDMNWMRVIAYDFQRFIGVDILPDMISALRAAHYPPAYHFQLGNIVTDILPYGDAIFLRDVLVHLPFAAIKRAVTLFQRAGFRYIMATTFPTHPGNFDCAAGEWRMLDMQKEPFFWPRPLMILKDNDNLGPPYDAKSIGVWALRDFDPG